MKKPRDSTSSMKILATVIVTFFCINIFAQGYNDDNGIGVIRTAVPFLNYSPDARGTGLGNSGVASAADPASMHWNPARYAFVNGWGGFSATLLPYTLLNSGYSGAYYVYETGFARLSERLVFASSYKFQDLYEMQFTDESGTSLGYFKPRELAIDAGLAVLLSKNISLGFAVRYINSNLTQGQTVQGVETTNGKSIAFDLALYWRKTFRPSLKFAWGLNISNIGSKMSYTKSNINKNFLPTNFRAGARLTLNFHDVVGLNFQIDMNKLLVPTPPIYARDSTGNPIPIPGTDSYVIAKGMDPNVGVFQGMIQSWYDAPGGFSEELKEFSFGLGFEIAFINSIFIRHGVYYQNKSKGNHSYFTIGAGMRVKMIGFDITYQRAFGNTRLYYGFDQTLRFTLLFNFGNPNNDFASNIN